MTIEEYSEFVKEGNPFFKFEYIIGEHHSVSYIIYAKSLSEASNFGVFGYVAVCEPCCYLHTDNSGYKKLIFNTSRVSISIDRIHRASECEIRELYKYLKYKNRL